MTEAICSRIATELTVGAHQVTAAVNLLDEGATVPFVARYRKEATGGLSDTQLRTLEERLRYLRDLEDRRAAILKSIEEQGKLTPELRAQIVAADTKQRLEDLYLPYVKKRRTKAQIAREAGLAPLAEQLLKDPTLDPATLAAKFVAAERGVADADAALEGARHILIETFAEDATLLGELREHLWQNAVLVSKVVKGKETEGQKFADWFDWREPIARIPSHRALAFLRGRAEGVLDLELLPQAEPPPDGVMGHGEGRICRRFAIADRKRKADRFLLETVRVGWKTKVFPHLDVELMARLRTAADGEAIKVFGANLRDLLLAAPAGARVTIGLDPGLRTGVKVAAVDATGKVLATGAIHPHAPRNDWDGSIATLAALVKKLDASLIAIGNGTASRETDKLVGDMLRQHPDLKVQKVVVSEAGASVYSASELASNELPDLDVSVRGAVSIARRLQDPLAELVKIEPKAIGVGQYQHDVDQSQLSRTLDAVVEDCVNAVGVDLNTASPALLRRVAGLGEGLAKSIVAYRDEHGAFQNRTAVLEVPRLGKKAFEQAAGFLRIRGGDQPLDQSAVHPEAYPVVERILERTGKDIRALIGDAAFVRGLRPQDYTDERFGVPTVADILRELEKPGRDPRPEFATATFNEKVQELKDLEPGMMLEGVVTNVTNFGAFVDVGVHHDGLVHVSCLADKFVADPREVVRAGQVVKVKVLEVDLQRQRIALTMRLTDKPGSRDERREAQRGDAQRGGPRREERTPREEPAPPSLLAQQLSKLKLKGDGGR